MKGSPTSVGEGKTGEKLTHLEPFTVLRNGGFMFIKVQIVPATYDLYVQIVQFICLTADIRLDTLGEQCQTGNVCGKVDALKVPEKIPVHNTMIVHKLPTQQTGIAFQQKDALELLTQHHRRQIGEVHWLEKGIIRTVDRSIRFAIVF